MGNGNAPDWCGYSKDGVCPMEDAIIDLLNYLVDPYLSRNSNINCVPSQSEQELVGKQVHATVVLYNYYHRKQHPHLHFLHFESFCKLSVILKPKLIPYLSDTRNIDHTCQAEQEKKSSLTEERVIDACNLSASLDASMAEPTTHGWPISKVAVFLVDSKKKNCFMQFGSLVKGVWSLIEKDIDLPAESLGRNMNTDFANCGKERMNPGYVHNDPCNDEMAYRQLAYLAVENSTGITGNGIRVLERHTAYSINKENKAVSLYIMQSTESKSDGLFQVPVEDAMNSLLGPLMTQTRWGWRHTCVVEHFLLLPYHKILLDWLARTTLHSCSSVQQLNDRKSFEDCSVISRENKRFMLPQTNDEFNYRMVSITHDNEQQPNKRLKQNEVDGPDLTAEAHIPGCILESNAQDRENTKKQLDFDTLNEAEISEALSLLAKKRDKLVSQRQELEDQIAQCDKDIKAVLSGRATPEFKLRIILEWCSTASVVQQTLLTCSQDQRKFQ